MSEDQVTIEVDGVQIPARKGAMLIEATDAAGIYIPRFCYHKKLSVAANCRMCLVEVERAPKPQPACATPVMDGMKVFTKSPKAIAGQEATMEFLLINHPLDCPICDQGGECELQDLALGYGTDVSQYTERKRVVKDKNIGPLVQTDMTRCIHCTRCVRFGEEIAGLRELGATGRGENMEIGTYVAQAVTSELSGNVIDLCPVGALTSKPYRFSARAWEMRQFDGIAPHDCVGSNVHVHTKGQVVKRVVPKENEAVNETWIADRDRFAYQGLNSADRLLKPRLKDNGTWRDCDWDTALAAAQKGLAAAGARLGALASPNATSEEFLLLQRLVRGLGSQNVDHRLRQIDFAGQANEPAFPGLEGSFDDLERANVVLLLGANPRLDQPLLNNRLRKAVAHGTRVYSVDCLAHEFNYELAGRAVVAPGELAAKTAGLAKAAGAALDAPPADGTLAAIAEALKGAERAFVLVGNFAQRHPSRAALVNCAGLLAAATNAKLGLLTEGANAAGAWLAGAVPHRLPGGTPNDKNGLDAGAMLDKPLAAYVLLAVEPDRDFANPQHAQAALGGAECVVALSAWRSDALEQVADLLLPIGVFAENEGTYVNVCGLPQAFAAAVRAPGEARPAWKVLRAVGERLGLAGFDAVTLADVTRELANASGGAQWSATGLQLAATPAAGVTAILEIPMYATDALVRRASALQQMPQAGDGRAYFAAATLAKLGLAAGQFVNLSAGGPGVMLVAAVDESVPAGCCKYYGARGLGIDAETGAKVEVSQAASQRVSNA
ncbi:MAG: NADH-quinone oxidoreductase subunit G [Gammaproteobacteria bacterium]|nr:NADH-quinone oxidoreductase subunit G [Gammaproteobacteria bacterium]